MELEGASEEEPEDEEPADECMQAGLFDGESDEWSDSEFGLRGADESDKDALEAFAKSSGESDAWDSASEDEWVI